MTHDNAEPVEDSRSAAERLAAEIRRLRREADLSQSQLAAKIGYSPQYVSLAERPSKGIPSAAVVSAIDNALGAGGALTVLGDTARTEQQARRDASQRPTGTHARAVPTHIDNHPVPMSSAAVAKIAPSADPALLAAPRTTHLTVGLEDMKRRTLMAWGVTAAVAASVGAGSGMTVGLSDVNRLRRAATRLHRLDQQHGADGLWHAAVAHAHEGVQLLEYGRYSDAVGRNLLTATGQLHICAGWLAFDAGQDEVARTCFIDALVMGRQADDAQIETRALANLAYQSSARSRPREALRYAAGAESAATGRGAARWLAVVPQLRLAIASSLTGETSDADRAIGQARRVLELDSGAAREEWSAFLSPAEVDGIEATCAIELKRPAHAERLLVQTIASYPTQCSRNLAGWRVRLARARLDGGAVDGAAEAAHSALDDLEGDVASWRVAAELHAVAQRLAAYPRVDGVASFFARYQAVN